MFGEAVKQPVDRNHHFLASNFNAKAAVRAEAEAHVGGDLAAMDVIFARTFINCRIMVRRPEGQDRRWSRLAP